MKTGAAVRFCNGRNLADRAYHKRLCDSVFILEEQAYEEKQRDSDTKDMERTSSRDW